MAFMLATVEDVKSWQKATQDESLDQLIGRILRGVTVRFASHCGREWDRKSYTVSVSPTGRSRSLFLVNTPIAASPAVQIWQHLDGVFNADSLLDPLGYRVDLSNGHVWRKELWAEGFQTVKLTYAGGYLNGDGLGAPDDLRLLAIMQASFLYQRRAELGISARSTEGGSLTMHRDITLLPEVVDGLWTYKVNMGIT